MKKIHFHEVRFKDFLLILMLFSIPLVLLGGFEIIEFENKKINKIMVVLGFLFQVIFYARMFWYKNYVEWNKLGITFRINSILPKSIIFKNVKTVEVESNKVQIIDKLGNVNVFDVENIVLDDVMKLIAIINEKSGLKNVA